MVFIKRFITLSVICSLWVCSSTAWAMIDRIDSIEIVKTRVKALRLEGVGPEEICVVFGFYGVIVEEAEHSSNLHLKDKIMEFLQYLEEEKIPNLVATARNDFNSVINDGIFPLGLQGFFDVKQGDAELEDFTLGSNERNFVGYRNGRVFALKKADAADKYYRQKVYSLQLAYPTYDLKHVFFLDGSTKNLDIFARGMTSITHTEKHEIDLSLYLLKKSK